MAIVRSEKTKITGKQNRSGMYQYASRFNDLCHDVLQETGYDLLVQPRQVFTEASGRGLNLLKDFFLEESYDPNEFTSAEDVKAWNEEMELQFENDITGIKEHTVTGDMNALIGMSTTMHKQILMNNIYDKGAIQKLVTDDQKLVITQQYRYLVDTDGNEIDMFREQNKMTAAINRSNPVRVFELSLPEIGATDIVNALGGTSESRLSVVTKLVAFKIPNVYFEVGDILPDENGYIRANGTVATVAGAHDVWYRLEVPFTATYATNDFKGIIVKQLSVKIKRLVDTAVTEQTITDTLTIGKDEKDRFQGSAARQLITGIRIESRLDASDAMLPTCYPIWKEKTVIEEIPDAIPMNTTFTPDSLKDIAANYKVDQLAEVMEMIKLVIGNYKDDMIKYNLEKSYEALPEERRRFGQFDYAPPKDRNFAGASEAWIRDSFYFYFDSYVTRLYQIFNDPNMTIACIGDPDLVRKASPTQVTYDSPAAIGPVDLNFFKKVSTSDKRVYQWIGSDKLRNDDEFTVLLNPTNNNKRITYRIIDYMFYISNEIRNAKNSLIPSVHAYERWKFSEYEAVQGRLQILNPDGMRPEERPNGVRTRTVTPVQ